MAQCEAHVMDVIQIHDEILFGNIRYNKVGLVEQVQNINNQINIINNAPKVDLSEYYSKSETDEKLDLKADQTDIIDAYTKTETDEKLDLKADKTELDEYVDLTSAQIITGQKQFGIISVSSISKQSKNDASILLAGGSDMLVSLLVSQPQLQEVRDTASGKSKGCVFETTQEMNTWIEDQENVAKLAIGDNLYIIDKEVMDYWWDGTALRALETELPDMSNVITTLGAATGNGNAITDISIDGNTLTPAKNDIFVITGFDQSIIGMKSFTSTIISNGIQYSGYDNNSVFLAGGGVKAISEIAPTADLIDYYNNAKTDELLSDKASVGYLDNYYDKHDVDEMINDANELIRAVEDQILTTPILSNFVQKTGEDLDQTIQGRLRQQLDERAHFDSMSDNLKKAEKIDLANYVTLDASQSINANKTFNNACRFTCTIDDQPYPEPTDDDYVTLGAVKGEFVSSIYNRSINGILTATQFIKSGGTDQQLLLANGSTKSLSDFTNSIDISNFVDKCTDQTIGGNKVFSLEVRAPTFKLPGYSTDYVVMSGAMKNKSHFVLTDDVDQTVIGTKTFSNNVTAPAFVKSDGTDQQVLLANGSTKPLSEFSGGGGDMTNYVQKIGADLQVINGKLRRGQDNGEEESDDEDYVTKGVYNSNTNNIINNYCVRKTGLNTQNVRGRLLYINPFGIEDDDSQLLTNTTYLTWLEVSNAITSKFYNFYQVLTPPVMFAGFTATQSSLIKINNQIYFFYLVVKPDSTIQAYQGRDICTVNPPPLYTIFCTLNSNYLAMFTDDGYVHFSTQATVWTQNSNVVINTFWVR
ncbi:MAG: hypothetical protein EZS28_003364 [Streblomastix strix]|uniref:Uncharacterized protein n=1 Tax=Streblomastix strix TaxID=222440 RepID=A0A5J4X2X7_9EUKA|nr:MAG: hypothetical protein EZS28_003364 [Streblomastix strix]